MDGLSANDAALTGTVGDHSNRVALMEFVPRLNREMVKNRKDEASVVDGGGIPSGSPV